MWLRSKTTQPKLSFNRRLVSLGGQVPADCKAEGPRVYLVRSYRWSLHWVVTLRHKPCFLHLQPFIDVKQNCCLSVRVITIILSKHKAHQQNWILKRKKMDTSLPIDEEQNYKLKLLWLGYISKCHGKFPPKRSQHNGAFRVGASRFKRVSMGRIAHKKRFFYCPKFERSLLEYQNLIVSYYTALVPWKYKTKNVLFIPLMI